MQKPDEGQAVPRLRRREFFKVGATSFMGFHLLPMLGPLNAFAEKKVNPRGTAATARYLRPEGRSLDAGRLRDSQGHAAALDAGGFVPASFYPAPSPRY